MVSEEMGSTLQNVGSIKFITLSEIHDKIHCQTTDKFSNQSDRSLCSQVILKKSKVVEYNEIIASKVFYTQHQSFTLF